jgi:AcrR family transcriptional regulator
MAGRKRKTDSPAGLQLPSGRHGLPRGFVVSNQRERIMKALVATMTAYGYGGSSVERIANRAGVSRRTLYEQFAGREDVYLSTYDAAAECLLERLAAAWEQPVDGSAQLRLFLQTLLECIAGEPKLARVCIVEVLSVGPGALERREARMREFAALLERGALAHNGAPLPPLAADGLSAAIFDVIYRRLAHGQAEELPELLEDLHSFCLMLFHYSPVAEPR